MYKGSNYNTGDFRKYYRACCANIDFELVEKQCYISHIDWIEAEKMINSNECTVPGYDGNYGWSCFTMFDRYQIISQKFCLGIPDGLSDEYLKKFKNARIDNDSDS